jgi:hypothetical protein
MIAPLFIYFERSPGRTVESSKPVIIRGEASHSNPILRRIWGDAFGRVNLPIVHIGQKLRATLIAVRHRDEVRGLPKPGTLRVACACWRFSALWSGPKACQAETESVRSG